MMFNCHLTHLPRTVFLPNPCQIIHQLHLPHTCIIPNLLQIILPVCIGYKWQQLIIIYLITQSNEQHCNFCFYICLRCILKENIKLRHLLQIGEKVHYGSIYFLEYMYELIIHLNEIYLQHFSYRKLGNTVYCVNHEKHNEYEENHLRHISQYI